MDEMHVGTPEQRALVQRFKAACEADERIVAAFLGGSFAGGTWDDYSDLDIYLVTTDEGYDSFFAERRDFMHSLGEPVFLEDFNDFGFDMLLFTFADGAEGELAMERQSNFTHIHGGPYEVLVDKKSLLAEKTFPMLKSSYQDQEKTLGRLIYWFWEDVSHFITCMNRNELWLAQGNLDQMRRKCVNLLRLRHDFDAEAAGYNKVEKALPEEELRPLNATFAPLEPRAMIEAGRVVVRTYKEVVRPLAQEHRIEYPAGIDALLSGRLQELEARLHPGTADG